MFYDLLVHVDLPDESRFVMALGNISNYLAALNGEPCTVVLLANGGAARFLARKDNAQTETIEKLAQAGVSYRVCANARKTCSPALKSYPPALWSSSASSAKTSPTSSRDPQNSRGPVVLKALSPPPKPSAEGFLFMKAT